MSELDRKAEDFMAELRIANLVAAYELSILAKEVENREEFLEFMKREI